MPASKHHISDARAIVGEYFSFNHQAAVDLVNEIANGFANYERQAFKRAAEIVREEGRKWPVPANVNMRGVTDALANTILAEMEGR